MVSRQNVRGNEGRKKINPFNEGQVSFKKGELGNPYPTNSNSNRSWEFGFNTAYFINLKKVKEYEQKISRRSEKVYTD